jgi:transposase-like protein
MFDMDRESLKLLLAQGVSVEQIARRFGKHPSTVSYWMEKYGLEAPNQAKYRTKGGTEREQLALLIDRGMTVAEIATHFGLSKTTVRYWMRRYELRTKNKLGPRHGQLTRDAKVSGLAVLTLSCLHHGETEFVIEGRGYYRCKRCRADAVARRRRRVKHILVAEAGGCCCVCGYDRYVGALEFHHLDPSQKRLEISRNGVALALDTLRAEARKCVLVCRNCHAEIEGGIVTVPLKLPIPADRADTP